MLLGFISFLIFLQFNLLFWKLLFSISVMTQKSPSWKVTVSVILDIKLGFLCIVSYLFPWISPAFSLLSKCFLQVFTAPGSMIWYEIWYMRWDTIWDMIYDTHWPEHYSYPSERSGQIPGYPLQTQQHWVYSQWWRLTRPGGTAGMVKKGGMKEQHTGGGFSSQEGTCHSRTAIS